MSEFFAMGGHGWFVWPAYAVAAIALGGLALASWMRRARARAELGAESDERAR
jgi:heme exporter protein CcmD